uniref:Uncharacterized protein n=1 Tax=Oncorhynchus tshawytscha TaxID=74940 RepID=A0AAZ3PSI8_ONCTS
ARISPKVVVQWVGTNNHGHTAEQICGGIMAIVQLIKDKLTCTGLLPRDPGFVHLDGSITHQDLYDYISPPRATRLYASRYMPTSRACWRNRLKTEGQRPTDDRMTHSLHQR